MNLRSMLNQVKSAFVIGKDNTFLHGRQGSQPAWQDQEPQEDYAAPQPGYAPQYQQPQYQPPLQQQAEPWQQPQQPWQQAPVYAPPQQQHQQQPPPYQQSQAPVYQQAPPAWQPPEHSFQTQISPEPPREAQRQRRAQQHQQPEQPAWQQPQQPQQAQPAENLVQFPGAQQARQLDAYVINVFSINSCRQAMSCLRKGQCTLIVMDQLIDKAEIRRYVDMLTGACYALNGTMTRLSTKIGFYIMAPSGMTVYTDPTTTNANAQPRPVQPPLYRGMPAQPQMPQRSAGFAAQEGYAAPQMNFQQHQAQPAQQPQTDYAEQEAQQPQQYAAWQEMQPQYQAQ